ncbi:hypothetical protein XAP412_850043 [Xanthomonas phaseoli pv. phaseoli]|uniref:Uncharacterized protein n=1 Tax=Xanthomonas campestris pv. phaseoli TaxID=317013 RepID=A0AB38E5G4_XANCH|nr:hypothetical protein XAP6984_880043 [Xanthomonas phaseoli pv. phaseoli]SON91086.1 hypothetical protein XAP412_850043 [Xanthomonas phaseoli pv. phaseoli]SON92787.1 hypothetical protein XAP7430_870041 [Xanthomonas phaseoli pv. phaseoli]SOO29749.1 hypothetical protein XAP6164_3600003 [Xanthomonas phaseoli pv. phaseoli]
MALPPAAFQRGSWRERTAALAGGDRNKPLTFSQARPESALGCCNGAATLQGHHLRQRRLFAVK